MSYRFGNLGGVAQPAMGWSDYNDSATAGSPIALGLLPVVLTNDGLGAFTNTSNWLPGVDPIWDTTSNRFDFSGLDVGDTVDIRVDLSVTVVGLNTQISTSIELGIGNTPYDLTIDTSAFLFSGTYQIVKWFSFYIGDENTRTGQGALRCASSDATDDLARVNGWYTRVIKR